MKTALFNIFVALFFACTTSISFGQKNDFETTSSPSTLEAIKASKAINLRVFIPSKGNKRYSIKLAGHRIKGICTFQGTGEPYALFADLNFDGHLDVWVTGFANSQGRSRCSDVWIFNPENKKYEYNSIISKINNLEVAPQEKKLEGGVPNCGCAGQCFFHDTYIWQSETLLKIARREQDCDAETITYQESALLDGSLKIIRQEKGVPDANEYARRQNGELRFLKWNVYNHK